MAHAAAWGGGAAGDEGGDGFLDGLLDEGGGVGFVAAADLADQDNAISFGVIVEHGEELDGARQAAVVVTILLGLQAEAVGDRGHPRERADQLDVATGELLMETGELGAQCLDLELRGLGLEHGEIDRPLPPPRHTVSPRPSPGSR